MNDSELKTFLKENQNIPARSGQEWSNLLHEIEKEKKSGFSWRDFSLKKLSFGIAGLAVFAIIAVNISKPVESLNEQARLVQIDSFLVADSYFSEVEDDLSWVGSL